MSLYPSNPSLNFKRILPIWKKSHIYIYIYRHQIDNQRNIKLQLNPKVLSEWNKTKIKNRIKSKYKNKIKLIKRKQE